MKNIFQAFFKNIAVDDLFQTRCILSSNMLSNVPLFYKNLVTFWGELKATHNPQTSKEIKREYIWLNPFITIGRGTVFYPNWYKNGIKYISDIIGEDGLLLHDRTIKARFGINFNFLDYYSLRHAIPAKWKTILEHEALTDSGAAPLADHTINLNMKSKDIYWKLQGAPAESIQATKWIEELNLDKEDWSYICKLPFECCYETKLQSFQYSLLYRFVPYKKRLYMMGLVDTDNCDYCTGLDSIVHRFVTCPVISKFWNEFSDWWRLFSSDITLDAKNIILGFYTHKCYTLNNCVLLAKYFIHRRKCVKGIISFAIFKGLLKQNITMEEHILLKNKKLNVFNDRWEHIRNFIYM